VELPLVQAASRSGGDVRGARVSWATCHPEAAARRLERPSACRRPAACRTSRSAATASWRSLASPQRPQSAGLRAIALDKPGFARWGRGPGAAGGEVPRSFCGGPYGRL